MKEYLDFDKTEGNYWLPGYYYSFNLDLKENSLDFTGITCGISPWVDDENTDKGETNRILNN